jgi:hypothetical protein
MNDSTEKVRSWRVGKGDQLVDEDGPFVRGKVRVVD